MKTIIITGASGNVGRAAVEKFLSEGWHILATVAPGESLGFHEHHKQITIAHVDLTDEADASDFVETVINNLGRIDAALFLVGGYAPGSLQHTDGKLIHQMMSLNFDTTYFLARPIFTFMVTQNYGRLVMIGARPGMEASAAKSSLAYGLSKSLLFHLAEVLNVEGSDHNVTTTVVVPSTIDTPQNREAMPNADFTSWVTPEAVANTIAFAVSPAADALRETVLKVYGRA